MSEHDEVAVLTEALNRVRTDETNLYVSLIKLRNLLGDNSIKTEIRAVLDILRDRINKLDKQTRK